VADSCCVWPLATFFRKKFVRTFRRFMMMVVITPFPNKQCYQIKAHLRYETLLGSNKFEVFEVNGKLDCALKGFRESLMNVWPLSVTWQWNLAMFDHYRTPCMIMYE